MAAYFKASGLLRKIKNNYKYLRLVIKNTTQGSTANTTYYSCGGKLIFYDDDNNEFDYDVLDTATSNTQNAYYPAANIFSCDESPKNGWFLKGTNSDDYLHIDIALNDYIDVLTYNHVKMLTWDEGGANRRALVVSLYASNDPTFTDYDVIRENINCDITASAYTPTFDIII